MTTIDISKLRQSPPPELAAYLLKLLSEVSEDVISNFIFLAVQRESLPPTVLCIWLSIAKKSETFNRALGQEFSISVRRAAIKRFFKPSRQGKWSDAWDALGTEGILSLLARMSVSEVKLCLNQIRMHSTGQAREGKITELFEGLMPLLYPESSYKTADQRPLGEIYQTLLPGCTTKFIDGVLSADTGHFAKQLKIVRLQKQYKLLRIHCLDIIFKGKKSSLSLQVFLRPLLESIPGLPSKKPGYSEPMLFSLTLLEKLAASPGTKIPGFSVLTQLINPLLKTLRDKKLNWSQTKEVVDLAIVYLSSHHEETKHLSLGHNGGHLLYFCVKLWASSPEMEIECEPRLVFLLKLMSGRINNIRAYISILNWAPTLKYKFLKLLFRYTWNKPIDIDSKESLKQIGSEIRWPCSLFNSLEVGKAVGLLKRIRDIRGDDFLEAESQESNSILSISSLPTRSNTDLSILFAILQPENPEVWEKGKATVEDRKKKAATSREEFDRAFYAKSALFYAISTGSLEIYSETLNWAKRFIRDHYTSRAIFEKSVCNTNEGIILLSGVPRTHLATFRLSDIAERVVDANKIIFQIFEMVCSAMKEPSFHRPNWSGPLDILGDVVRSRMACSKLVQQTLNLSDDQLYTTIWETTLDLILRIEKIGMQLDYEPLQMKKPHGIINTFCIGMEKRPKACFRFVDNLAKARDALWHSFRPSLHPAVTTLPPALPRGLPIQSLAPQFLLDIKGAAGLIPYISSRADLVVLAKPDILEALPEDEEIREAIGPFIDSYTYAIHIYAEQRLGPWKEHVLKAWRHALEHLSKRMNPDEAHRTWKLIFNRALPNFEIESIDPVTNMEYPVFPFNAEIGTYTEWNVGESFNPPAVVKSRTLEPLTYLDCTIAISFSTRFAADEKFSAKKLETQGFQPPEANTFGLWRLTNKQLRIPAVREGLIISALLFFEHGIPDWKGSLAKPFPSDDDVRYPDLWLDLSDPKNGDITAAPDVLGKLIGTVPPTFLQRVTQAAIDALDKIDDDDDAKKAKLERLAYGLLSLLAASDRPAIATDLILKVVINKPESSSWHRKLLSIGFINRLSAAQARELIQSFSNEIQRKMREPKSYIKITTIKYFAQLLNGTTFVEPSFAVGILSKLFQTSKHHDIRVSIVGSLIEMLGNCKETSLADLIFDGLKSAIPVAGSLNERQETDWKAAERTGNLPTIYYEDKPSPDLWLPPVLSIIIHTKINKRWRRRFFEEIITPIFELSIENNRKWVKLFVAKHELDLPSLRLPQLPVKPNFLKTLIQRFESNPTPQFLGLFQSFVLTNMSPSPKLAALNLKLQEPAFKDDLATKHWLSLYGQGTGVYWYDKFSLHRILRYDDTSNETVQIVQAMLGEQARVLLRLNDLRIFDLFMEKFVSSQTKIVLGDQLKNGRLAIERIITFIDSLRTPKWHESHNRQPMALPKTLKYKLWLLPYPTTDATEEDLAKFAQAVHESVQDMSWPGNAYHDEFALIKSAIIRVEVCHRAEIACLIGKLEWELDLIDVLCVELAKTLFETASVPKDPIIVTSRRILNQWKECVVESVRMKERELKFGVFHDKKWKELLIDN